MKRLVYKISKGFLLTSDLTRRIEGRMAILYPLEQDKLMDKVANELLRLYLIAMVTGGLLTVSASFSLYFSIVVCMTVYAIVNTSIYRSFDRLELQLLEQMLGFIEAVKFRFQFDGMLEEALMDAITESDDVMAVHGQLIYEHLKESYIRETSDYGEVSPHHFFLTFYSLCESVMKYGDKKDDKGSLFIKNLSYLKEDICSEVLKKQAVKGTFMGLGAICIIPVFCIKPIEIWAISNMPELIGAYEGVTGRVTTILLTLCSILVYKIVLSLRYPAQSTVYRRQWVKKVMSLSIVKHLNAGYMNRHLKSLKQTERMLKQIVYPYNIAEYCVKRFVSAVAVTLVVALVSLAVGCGIYFIPVAATAGVVYHVGYIWYIKVKRHLMAMEKEDEIIRFQGIILMLMHADRITVDQILMQMERFAVNFKMQIEEISDKLSYKGMSVFKEVKEQTEYLPFSRLLDGFIACDDMYICKAFEDVELDRKYYIEKHKQDNQLYIEQRGAVAKFISYIPLCAVAIVKLVIPFVVEGMRQMASSGMAI